MTAGQRRHAEPLYPPGTVLLAPADTSSSWQERALCAQTDPEAFFPEKGGSTREAKKVCGACEVRAECLEYALTRNEAFGIWGGLSERQRRALKRTRSASTVAAPAPEPVPADKTCLRCRETLPISRLSRRTNDSDTGYCHACRVERRNNRVTVSQLAGARRRREGGEPAEAIAADLGISPSQMRRLLAGSRHPVPDPVSELKEAS